MLKRSINLVIKTFEFFLFFLQIDIEFIELDEFYRMISSLAGYCKQFSGIQHHEIIQYPWKIVCRQTFRDNSLW